MPEYKTLEDYQNAKKNGLLFTVHCKLGMPVYVVASPMNVYADLNHEEQPHEIFEAVVSGVSFHQNFQAQYHVTANMAHDRICHYFMERDFGENIFFTREDAEAKLKEKRMSAHGKENKTDL